MQRNQPLFMLVAATLKQSAEEAGAIDSDAQQAIAALAQKYRAKESTLVYEPTLANPIASRIYELFDEKIESFKTRVAAEGGGALSFLDNMFKVLVHLERMSALRSNGRTRGRHFLSLLWKMFPSKNKEAQAAAQ